METNESNLSAAIHALHNVTKSYCDKRILKSKCPITYYQYKLLEKVAKLESLGDPKANSITRVSESLHLDRTTIHRNLKPLKALGLVSVGRTGRDHRVMECKITKSGKEVLIQCEPLINDIEKQVATIFPDPSIIMVMQVAIEECRQMI